MTKPVWLDDSLIYTCLMGSHAYGCATETSDKDYYGICIPPKNVLFQTINQQLGIEKFIPFEQYQVNVPNDINIYSIVKYINLLADGNPNIIDSLFVPEHCITFKTNIGEYLRSERNNFLSKNSFSKFRGWIYREKSLLFKGEQQHFWKTFVNKLKHEKEKHSLNNIQFWINFLTLVRDAQNSKKQQKPNSKRRVLIEKYGYDTKAACNCIRVALECIQILETNTLVLDKYSDLFKEIRNGIYTETEIVDMINKYDNLCEKVFKQSTLQQNVSKQYVNNVLLNCLTLKDVI